MNPKNQRIAAALVVARLVARDGLLDWREIEFLDRSGAYAMLGVSRSEFMTLLARCAGERLGALAAGRSEEPIDAEIAGVRERRLQLLVAALLVYLCEIDRDIEPRESALVERAFGQWRITPEVLESELRVPPKRTAAWSSPARHQRLNQKETGPCNAS